ncbi:AfsR/SARP family transcriptional regulator [Catelliglobosispora koreensis]|uniref:AfsR/SARP family transcriptional regulator n=1 Tax=Catelliglobosispora koreensis TaxID=129052 RepID=UPI000368E2B3|nr:BTAD domain-containing putative transcriptional regulator [Catelliglobosispora koreensis]
MLEFGVLGPLLIRRDGAPVELSSAMLRRLTAILLAKAGIALTADTLIDALWDGSPPPTARKTLQVYVHRLRQALGGEETVPRGPDGYRLCLDQGSLDAQEFLDLLAKAEAGQDPAGSLRAALNLWRGPAFAGVNDTVLLAEHSSWLEEQRLVALQTLAGLGPGLVKELTEAAAAHPYREALHARLMIALYHDGRQADALEVYRRIREQLAQDLGIDPGPELRETHEQVLRGNVPRSGQAASPSRNFLPPDVADFTGRAQEMSQLDLLTQDQPTIAITTVAGTAGVGKTALAIRWANRNLARFPDGQLYLNLRGYDPGPPLRTIDALTQLLICLGVPAEKLPIDVDTAAALYRAEVAGKHMLILLDNASSAEQIRPLLPGGQGCVTLVTSRDRLSGLISRDGAQRLTLDTLPEADAMALLRRILGEDRLAAEPDAAQQLVAICARLPLALRIAAAQLADEPSAGLAGYLAKVAETGALDALAIEGDASFAVQPVFHRSYVELPLTVQRAFRLLGVLPAADFTAETLAVLAAVTEGEATTALDCLNAAHVIEQNAAGRFSFHDLLRQFARKLAHTDGCQEWTEALARLGDWYCGRAAAAGALIYPGLDFLPSDPGGVFSSRAEALSWLDAEAPSMLAFIVHADSPVMRRHAWYISDGMRPYYRLRRLHSDWLRAAASALQAADAEGDLIGHSAAHLGMGNAYHLRGDQETARHHYQATLESARAAGWDNGEGAALSGFGVAYYVEGRLAESVEYTRESLVVARRLGSDRRVATLLNNLGFVCMDLGRLAEAEAYCSEALALHRRDGASVSVAYDLLALAMARHDMGRNADAIATCQEALQAYRELGDRGGQESALVSLSEMFAAAGDAQAAEASAREALAIADEIDTPRNTGNACLAMAMAAKAAGDLTSARRYAEQAFECMTQVNDRAGLATSHWVLALVHHGQGDTETARKHAATASEIAEDRGYSVIHARAQLALASAAMVLGHRGTARAHATAAAKLATTCGAAPERDAAHALLATL